MIKKIDKQITCLSIFLMDLQTASYLTNLNQMHSEEFCHGTW